MPSGGRVLGAARDLAGTSRGNGSSWSSLEFEPGHHPPATSPPSPPRCQPGHEPESSAVFRVSACRAQLRHPGAAAIGDFHPDSAGAGRHRDRDRLPGNTRAAVLETIGEKLAREEHSVIPARMPRAEDRADERADNPSPLHQPGNLHALANRRPSHQRTAFPPAREDPQGPDGRTGNRRSPLPPSSSRIRTVNRPPARRQPGTPACHVHSPGEKPGPARQEAESPSSKPAGRRISYHRGDLSEFVLGICVPSG